MARVGKSPRKPIRKGRNLGSIDQASALGPGEELKTITEEIQVTRENPAYIEARNKIKAIDDQIILVETERRRLTKRFTSISNNSPELAATIAGAAIGGGGYAVSKKKPEKAKAAWFALLGGAIGFVGSNLTKPNEKQRAQQLANIQQKIHQLNKQLNTLELQKFDGAYHMEQLPKTIKATEKRQRQIVAKKEERARVELPKFGELEKIKVLPQNTSGEPKERAIPLSEFKEKKFSPLGFSGEWLAQLGNPSRGFRMLIYGQNGHGKSTYAIKFADYLANNHGYVLYNSSEERLGLSLQKKLMDTQSQYFEVSKATDINGLRQLLQNPKYAMVFIDSVNDMNISFEEFKELLQDHKNRSFIYLMQATKTGEFRGDNRFAHECDIRVKVHEREAITEKTRY